MMILAVMMVMTISANAMSYNAAKNEALFLSDKMAYELNLTAAQYEAVYEINLDYLMSLNGHGDVFGIWWDRRNADLRYVLNSWQYDKYVALSHFYRPVAWKAGSWTFAVYSHYNRGHFYNDRPTVFVTKNFKLCIKKMRFLYKKYPHRQKLLSRHCKMSINLRVHTEILS